MKTRAVALVCLALFAQGFCVEVNIENGKVSEAELRGAKEAAIAAFNVLMAAVDTAIDAASDVLNAAYSTVNSTVVELEETAQDVIAAAMDPLNEKLNEYIQKAADLGLNVTQCQPYIDNLTDLPSQIFSDLSSCMTTKLDTAKGYVDDALEQCQYLERNMTEFADKIQACNGTIWQQTTCLTSLVVEITAKTAKIPVEIALDASKAAALIAALVPSVKVCFAVNTAKVSVEGLKLLSQFAVCAALPNSSSLIA